MSPWGRRVPRRPGKVAAADKVLQEGGRPAASRAVPPVGVGGKRAALTRAGDRRPGRLRTAPRRRRRPGGGRRTCRFPRRPREPVSPLGKCLGEVSETETVAGLGREAAAQAGRVALAGRRRPRALSLRRRARRLAAPDTLSSRDEPGRPVARPDRETLAGLCGPATASTPERCRRAQGVAALSPRADNTATPARRAPRGRGDGPCRGSGSPGRGEAGSIPTTRPPAPAVFGGAPPPGFPPADPPRVRSSAAISPSLSPAYPAKGDIAALALRAATPGDTGIPTISAPPAPPQNRTSLLWTE